MARGGSYLIDKEGDAPKLVEAPTAPAPAKDERPTKAVPATAVPAAAQDEKSTTKKGK